MLDSVHDANDRKRRIQYRLGIDIQDACESHPSKPLRKIETQSPQVPLAIHINLLLFAMRTTNFGTGWSLYVREHARRTSL